MPRRWAMHRQMVERIMQQGVVFWADLGPIQRLAVRPSPPHTRCRAKASACDCSACKSPARPTPLSSRAQAKTVLSAHRRRAKAKGSVAKSAAHKLYTLVAMPWTSAAVPRPPSPPLPWVSHGRQVARRGAANTFNNIEQVYSRAIAFSNRRCSVPLESMLPTAQLCTVSSSKRTAFT